jgi:hypothetical protein
LRVHATGRSREECSEENQNDMVRKQTESHDASFKGDD